MNQRQPTRSGGGDGLRNRARSILRRDQRAGVQAVTAATKVDSAPSLKPEEQIPLDDEDFRDF